MTTPHKFLVEGIDRIGKNRLIDGILDRSGYYHVLHYEKPKQLSFYATNEATNALRAYQEDSFRTMFSILRDAPSARIVCNRAHLGECVYAPKYRKYSGDYVFELEREFAADSLPATRLILLIEDFERSRHFVDDGKSIGAPDQRKAEQALFIKAIDASIIVDKRIINVTDRGTGGFRHPDEILQEALA